MRALPLLALAVVSALWWTVRLGYRVNLTASMPEGVWRVLPQPSEIKRGDVVVVCLPDAGVVHVAIQRGYIGAGSCPDGREPLVKPVGAVAGDIVTISADGVAVNGQMTPGTVPLTRDEQGRTLEHVPFGSTTIAPAHLWFLSAHTPFSFDSRYFGAMPVSVVQARAEPVAVAR